MDGRTAFHVLILRPLLRALFGLHAQGTAQLAALPQFLIVANHNSHLDALLLMSVLPRERIARTHPVAAADHFGRSRRLARLMDRLLAPVWVDRAAPAADSVAAMERALAAGDSLILFPEGTRGAPGQLAPFKSGVGWLLERHPELAVIPACISGPERALPRGAALPLPVWNRVLLGPARRLAGPPRELAHNLQSEVAELVAAERARRQTRTTPRRATRTLALLGIDGSGKSTLARRLALALSTAGSSILVGDELQRFAGGEALALQPLPAERLRQRLSRRAKSAHSLGGYKLPKLAELLLREELTRESRRWYDPDWVLQDGSPLINLAAWLALYREGDLDADFAGAALLQLAGRGSAAARRRHPELRRLRALVPFRLELPAAAVFISLPPETAVARIAARGEARQVHETVEKLALLQRSYAAVCDAAAAELGLALLRLDATQPIEALTDEAARFARALGEGKHGH